MNEFLYNGFLDDASLFHWTEYAQMKYTHTHSQYELYFCPDDTEQHAVINGVDYRYKYPCVIISSPFTVHSMSSIDEEAKGFDRYVFNFSENIISLFDSELLPKGMLEKNTGYMFRLEIEQAEDLKRMIDTVSPKNQSETKLLLVTFLNRLAFYSPVENAICVGVPSGYIQDILQYITEHHTEELNANIIAKRFSISRSKLDRDFKKFTGVTVHSFIDICRLNQAKILLKNRTDLSVGEIADMSGFTGENYFFAFFKNHTGQTPTEFKKQFKNQK